MTRRQLIVAGLMAPLGFQKYDTIFKEDPVEAVAVGIKIPKPPANFKGRYYALKFQYGDDVVRFTPEEVMKALKEKPNGK